MDYSILLEVRGYNRRYIRYFCYAVRMGNKKGKEFKSILFEALEYECI